MATKFKKWTEAEIAILRMHFPVSGAKGCAIHLPGIDGRRIEAKAYRLGLRSPRYGKPITRVKWTPFLDRQIRLTYQDPTMGTVKAAAKRMGIEYGAFRARARVIGCVGHYANRPWTPQEDDLVRENATKGLYVIHRIISKAGFNRSVAAISTRLVRLDCDRQDPDSLTGSQLSRLCGVNPKAVYRWCECGHLKAKRGGSLHRVNAKPDLYWIVKIADFRTFVRNYPCEIDLRKVDQPWFLEVMLGLPRALVEEKPRKKSKAQP